MIKRIWLAISVVTLCLSSMSCAALNVNSVPMPGSSYSDGYDITLQFANVLNLPERAKVIMDGTTVGVVTNISLAENGVELTARIDRDVEVPDNVHALLQQATVLGDIYVALERNQDAQPAGLLAADGIVPLSQTTSPPQLEDTLANLANFVGSGSIQRAQDTVINVNRVTPELQDVRSIAARVATDLADLDRNIDTVDILLSGVSDTAAVLAKNTPSFQFWLSPEGIRATKHLMVLVHPLATVLPSLGTIYNGGYWMSPLVGSLADVFGAMQQAKWNVEEAYHNYRTFMLEYFLPQDRFPAINITSIVGPDGRELSGNIQQVLSMIGGMR